MPYAPPKHRPPGWRPAPPKPSPAGRFYGSGFWQELCGFIRHRDRGLCVLCGGPGARVDHIIPRAQGGADHPSNLRLLCVRCDAQRHRDKGYAWRG